MKLVVTQHRPYRRATIVAGFVIGAIAAVAVAFHYGQWNYIVASLDSSQSKRGLIEENVDLKREVEALKRELAKSRRSMAVDETARANYHTSLSELQSELSDLKLELAFYRDIVSSGKPQTGPQVRGFKIQDFDGQGRYQYRLVLTHVNKDDKVADGNIAVEFRGKREGVEQRIDLGEIAESGADSLAFKFKHFRRIEGILELPEGFSPREVHVAVQQRGQRDKSFSHVYKWASLVN